MRLLTYHVIMLLSSSVHHDVTSCTCCRAGYPGSRYRSTAAECSGCLRTRLDPILICNPSKAVMKLRVMHNYTTYHLESVQLVIQSCRALKKVLFVTCTWTCTYIIQPHVGVKHLVLFVLKKSEAKHNIN